MRRRRAIAAAQAGIISTGMIMSSPKRLRLQRKPAPVSSSTPRQRRDRAEARLRGLYGCGVVSSGILPELIEAKASELDASARFKPRRGISTRPASRAYAPSERHAIACVGNHIPPRRAIDYGRLRICRENSASADAASCAGAMVLSPLHGPRSGFTLALISYGPEAAETSYSLFSTIMISSGGVWLAARLQ